MHRIAHLARRLALAAALASPSLALAQPSPAGAPAPSGPQASPPAAGDDRDERDEVIEVESAAPTTRTPPPVEGAVIYAGKKVTRTALEELPPLGVGYQRQALALTPGLLISEVTNQAWTSLSYRGLGEPHESWNILTLRDGVPLVPDMFGYPASYITPAPATVERIEFVRGGASLLHGPQPGGALDYVSLPPGGDKPLGATARAMVGGYGTRSLDLAAMGTLDGADRLSYRAEVHRAQFDGMRPNADSDVIAAGLSAGWSMSRKDRVSVRLDAQTIDAGEPGGLSRDQFEADRTAGTTPDDRVQLARFAAVTRYERELSEATRLDVRAWASDFERASRRQASTRFGELANPDHVSLVQRQHFQTVGAVARVRHDLRRGDTTHRLTGGVQVFGSRAPVSVRKGTSPTDWEGDGALLVQSRRGSLAGSAFGEAIVSLGRLSVVPGVRVDVLRQRVRETLDLATGPATMGDVTGDPTGELGARRSVEAVVLPGLGLTYAATDEVEAYANVTRGYKPILFNDGVTFQAGIDVAATFDPTFTTTAEAGVRFTRPWLFVDASAFQVRFSDQVGLLGNDMGGATRTNIGRMVNQGLDLAAEVDPLGALAALRGRAAAPGRLKLYGSAQLLDAEIVSGEAEGNRPQYAPPYLVRAGLMYQHGREGRDGKVSLLGTFVGAHSGVDNAAPLFDIPAYAVWDLLYEVRVPRLPVTVYGGVTNLLDATYFSRVRPGGGGGIDPGIGRMAYLGLGGTL